MVSAPPIQKRRVKSTSSGFGPSSPVGTPLGSKAIPQIGQSPGPTCSISGCIGQVKIVPSGIGSGAGPAPKYVSGSASNLSLHRDEQNRNSSPA